MVDGVQRGRGPASRKFTRRPPSTAEQARRTRQIQWVNALKRRLGYL